MPEVGGCWGRGGARQVSCNVGFYGEESSVRPFGNKGFPSLDLNFLLGGFYGFYFVLDGILEYLRYRIHRLQKP